MVKWMSIPEYTKKTGLSRNNILRMIDKGELIATTTDGGEQLRIKAESDPELDRLNDQINQANDMIRMLCDHLGVSTEPKRFY